MKTVRTLISELLKENPDAVVYMSVDPEGNAFKQFDELSTGLKDGDGEIEHVETKWSLSEPSDPNAVVILWPT